MIGVNYLKKVTSDISYSHSFGCTSIAGIFCIIIGLLLAFLGAFLICSCSGVPVVGIVLILVGSVLIAISVMLFALLKKLLKKTIAGEMKRDQTYVKLQVLYSRIMEQKVLTEDFFKERHRDTPEKIKKFFEKIEKHLLSISRAVAAREFVSEKKWYLSGRLNLILREIEQGYARVLLEIQEIFWRKEQQVPLVELEVSFPRSGIDQGDILGIEIFLHDLELDIRSLFDLQKEIKAIHLVVDKKMQECKQAVNDGLIVQRKLQDMTHGVAEWVDIAKSIENLYQYRQGRILPGKVEVDVSSATMIIRNETLGEMKSFIDKILTLSPHKRFEAVKDEITKIEGLCKLKAKQCDHLLEIDRILKSFKSIEINLDWYKHSHLLDVIKSERRKIIEKAKNHLQESGEDIFDVENSLENFLDKNRSLYHGAFMKKDFLDYMTAQVRFGEDSELQDLETLRAYVNDLLIKEKSRFSEWKDLRKAQRLFQEGVAELRLVLDRHIACYHFIDKRRNKPSPWKASRRDGIFASFKGKRKATAKLDFKRLQDEHEVASRDLKYLFNMPEGPFKEGALFIQTLEEWLRLLQIEEEAASCWHNSSIDFSGVENFFISRIDEMNTIEDMLIPYSGKEGRVISDIQEVFRRHWGGVETSLKNLSGSFSRGIN